MTFSINIPHFKCLVRAEFLYNLESHFGEFVPCRVFGATSINGRSVGFNLMTINGAQIARVPVHALAQSEDAGGLPLDWLQLWDCFSYEMTAVKYDYLSEMRCNVMLKDKNWYPGTYLFTFDWCGGDYAEDPSEHKCGHVIALDNGCFAIQPNNRIYWEEPGFITKPFALSDRPGYKVNTHLWKSEICGKWVSEDSDRMFYDVNVKDSDDETPVGQGRDSFSFLSQEVTQLKEAIDNLLTHPEIYDFDDDRIIDF